MIKIFFGSPGCGKTTLICKHLCKLSNKKAYDFLFTNVETLTSASYVSSKALRTLGKWTFPQYSYFALDEAGIEYNNRDYKHFPHYTISWFKLHRHYKVDIDIFSQSWEDMDITIRRLADELWYVKRFGPWTLCRRVYKTVGIDDNKQISDMYRMEKGIWLFLQPLRLLGLSRIFTQLKGWRLMFRPFYYGKFDSWQTPPTPVGVPE